MSSAWQRDFIFILFFLKIQNELEPRGIDLSAYYYIISTFMLNTLLISNLSKKKKIKKNLTILYNFLFLFFFWSVRIDFCRRFGFYPIDSCWYILLKLFLIFWNYHKRNMLRNSIDVKYTTKRLSLQIVFYESEINHE